MEKEGEGVTVGVGVGVGGSGMKGKFMVMWVISLFPFLCFDGLLGPSSSPEESESVASWSVRMTRRSFLCGGGGFLESLHGGWV